MTGGIYQIRNIVAGKVYVGSSVDLNDRRCGHWRDLVRGRHRNRYLQNAYKKYGDAAFVFEILEYVTDRSLLLGREQHWIDALKSANDEFGYNLAPKAGSNLGIRLSAETRAALSRAHTGKTLSEEHKQRLREVFTGRKMPAGSSDKGWATRRKNGTDKWTMASRERTRLIRTGLKQSPQTVAKRVAKNSGSKRPGISKMLKARWKAYPPERRDEICAKISASQLIRRQS